MQSLRRRTLSIKLAIALVLSTSVGLPANTVAAPTMNVQTTQGRSDPKAKGITGTNIRLAPPARKLQRTPSIEAAPQEQPGYSINASETFELIGVYER